MPVERRPEPKAETYPELVEVLAAELREPTAAGPYIIEEKLRGLRRYHVTVIWDRWSEVPDPSDRSALILDAYERAFDSARMLEVSLALGLTRIEAQRLGIVPAQPADPPAPARQRRKPRS